ncbi:ABC transporter transmembrane domain-containing protein, partial [Escherichia coli]
MMNDKDLSTWPTFRRLWPMITPFKTGLIVSAIALIMNAAGDTLMLSLLKPLLDDGFGKTDSSVLVWMPLAVIALMLMRGVTSFVSSYCISWVSGMVVMQMRRRLF